MGHLCDGIKLLIVYTHAYFAILLGHKENRRRPGTP